MAIGPGHGRGGGRGLGTHTQGRGGVPGRGVGHAPPVGVVGLRGTTLPTRGAIQTRGTTERIVPPASKTLRTTNVGSPVAVRANDAPPANTTRREGGTATAETRLPAPGTTMNSALSQCTQHNVPTQIQQRSLNDTELNRRSIARQISGARISVPWIHTPASNEADIRTSHNESKERFGS